MATFFVTTTLKGDRGAIWFPFAVEGVEEVLDLLELFRKEGVVLGKKIQVGRDEAGERTVKERSDCILGIGIVGQILHPNFSVPGPHGWTARSKI